MKGLQVKISNNTGVARLKGFEVETSDLVTLPKIFGIEAEISDTIATPKIKGLQARFREGVTEPTIDGFDILYDFIPPQENKLLITPDVGYLDAGDLFNATKNPSLVTLVLDDGDLVETVEPIASEVRRGPNSLIFNFTLAAKKYKIHYSKKDRIRGNGVRYLWKTNLTSNIRQFIYVEE